MRHERQHRTCGAVNRPSPCAARGSRRPPGYAPAPPPGTRGLDRVDGHARPQKNRSLIEDCGFAFGDIQISMRSRSRVRPTRQRVRCLSGATAVAELGPYLASGRGVPRSPVAYLIDRSTTTAAWPRWCTTIPHGARHLPLRVHRSDDPPSSESRGRAGL